MLLETEAGIWAKADATVFQLLMKNDRTGRRLRAADRTIANAHRRVEALRRRKGVAEAREHAKAAREVERELESVWGKTVRVRVSRLHVAAAERSKHVDRAAGRAAMSSIRSTRAIRVYRVPLVDTRGRTALYFRIRYVGFKSKNWRSGLAADHALYILREEALENGHAEMAAVPLSNMGYDAEEIAACWRALEEMEEGYRANAKVQYRIVWNLPHELDAQQRRDLVEDFCERTFGRLGLPWVAAVHSPDARGDSRNYHAHVCFSTRPCERVGDHEWAIAQEKVNGLTDAAGLKLMRALAAGHMNIACGAANLPRRFTHQTYKDRGIDAVRQEHVGARAMAAHERGEAVAVIERNAFVVNRNELVAERDAVVHKIALSERLVTALNASADLAARRRSSQAALSAARRIAAMAKAIVAANRLRAVPQVQPLLAQRASEQAWQIIQRIVSRQTLSPPSSVKSIDNVGATARELAARRLALDERRRALVLGRERLEHIQQEIAAREASAAEDRKRRARAHLLGAAARPYRIESGRVTMDLSALAPAEASLVRTLDRDALVAILRERIRRDQDQDAADARARAVTEAQRVDEERRRQVEEACRILRDAPKRPFRLDGKRITPDLSCLNEADRERVAAVGFSEPALQQVLIDRARTAERFEAMLDAIRRDRHYLGEVDGQRIVGPEYLSRFGIHAHEIHGSDAQVSLQAIATIQSGEVAQIATYLGAHPDHLLRINGRWDLVKHAPVEVRELVGAWRNDALMQTALAHVAASARRVGEPSTGESTPLPNDQVDSSPPGIAALPKLESERSVQAPERTEEPSVASPSRRRWHPGMFGGNGFGD